LFAILRSATAVTDFHQTVVQPTSTAQNDSSRKLSLPVTAIKVATGSPQGESAIEDGL
jgi:hypothetical protein